MERHDKTRDVEERRGRTWHEIEGKPKIGVREDRKERIKRDKQKRNKGPKGLIMDVVAERHLRRFVFVNCSPPSLFVWSWSCLVQDGAAK